MPLSDIAAGLFEIIIRVAGQILLEIIIKGPGYVIVRIFATPKRGEGEPDEALAVAVGIAFWIIIGAGAFFTYMAISDE